MPIQEDKYYKDQTFDRVSVAELEFAGRQFDHCTFTGCDFSDINLKSCDFTKSTFFACNFSMVKFNAVGLDQVKFDDCKLVGADFSNAKDFLFSANFVNCRLDYAVFQKKKNKKSLFRNCSLIGAEFSEADFTGSVFDNCDLSSAVFMRSNLGSVNFTTSYNFIIDPEKNQLRKARFSANGLVGLLANYDIVVE